MRESFTYGSVGRALRKQCLYPEPDGVKIAVLREVRAELIFIWAAAHAQRYKATELFPMNFLNFRSYFIFFSLIYASFLCVWPAFSQETEHENNNAILSEHSKDWITNWVGQELPPTARELNIFKKISSGMTMKGVFLIVGLPDFIKGSGLSIFTYTLNDGSEIWIGAADMEGPPLYVTHFTKDGHKKQLLS